MPSRIREEVGPNPAITYFPAVITFGLAGLIMPGKWTLTSADKQFGWQIQQGYGLSGAFVFPAGEKLITPKFKGEIWRNLDAQSFREIRKVLLKKPAFIGNGSMAVKALGIDHPELNEMGCTSVVIASIGALIQRGGGMWETEIELIQYRAPQLAPNKPDQTIPGVTTNPPITALTAAEVELQNQTAIANSLKGT